MQNLKNSIDYVNDPLILLNDYINEHDSFETDATMNDDYNDNLGSYIVQSRPHSRTSYKFVFLTYIKIIV